MEEPTVRCKVECLTCIVEPDTCLPCKEFEYALIPEEIPPIKRGKRDGS